MNELPLRKIFAILDGETKGPDLHNGPIGLNLSKCEEADVAGFIPIEIDQIFKRYLENCQDLGSDQQYLRDIVLSINYGVINNSLKRRSPGKLGNARWLTTANRILRYYTSQNNPTLNLVYLVRFVIKVYARNWFAIKYQPRFTNAPKHIFNFIENIHELDCELIRDECFRTISRNSFLLHTESILIGMLSDTNPSVRIEAVKRILQARVNGEKDGIRYFRLPKIDFNATHYYNLVLYVDDWLEPILTRSYSTEDLRTYTVENIDIFDFPDIPCHSQHVERTIRLVSETATKLADPKERDQRIRMTIHFRKCMPHFNSKQDFTM